jgi:hypothetical protein
MSAFVNELDDLYNQAMTTKQAWSDIEEKQYQDCKQHFRRAAQQVKKCASYDSFYKLHTKVVDQIQQSDKIRVVRQRIDAIGMEKSHIYEYIFIWGGANVRQFHGCFIAPRDCYHIPFDSLHVA